MSETRTRRYAIMGEGVTVTGETLEEARARFRDQRRERRSHEPAHSPASAEPEHLFDGERFFESVDEVFQLRRSRTR